MPELTPVTVSTSSPQWVVTALGQLAVAYFERLTARDWARASVVLVVFANNFNEHREGVVRYIYDTSSEPARTLAFVPSAPVSTVFSSETRRALQIMLLLYVGSSIGTALDSMPTTPEPTAVQRWWESLIKPRLPAPAFDYAIAVANDSMTTLASNLQVRVDSRIYGTHGTVTREAEPTPFDLLTQPVAPPTTTAPTVARGGDVTFRVPGYRPAWVVPTWAWWAVGLGGVAAAGVLAYGVIEKGWFKKGRRR